MTEWGPFLSSTQYEDPHRKCEPQSPPLERERLLRCGMELREMSPQTEGKDGKIPTLYLGRLEKYRKNLKSQEKEFQPPWTNRKACFLGQKYCGQGYFRSTCWKSSEYSCLLFTTRRTGQQFHRGRGLTYSLNSLASHYLLSTSEGGIGVLSLLERLRQNIILYVGNDHIF